MIMFIITTPHGLMRYHTPDWYEGAVLSTVKGGLFRGFRVCVGECHCVQPVIKKVTFIYKQLMVYCVITEQGCLVGVFSCYQDAHIVAKRQGATVQQCSLNSECGIDAPVCSSIAVSHAADHRGAVPNILVPDRAQA